MKDAQKPDHVSLTTLVTRLKEGRFVVPDFQREFEWEPADIRDLMRSVFLDYYIGSLLLWKATDPNISALACEPLYGFRGDSSPEHIVLDGQQRLTAMHYAFTAPAVSAPGRANRFLYFIHVDRFMQESYDDAFEYFWTQYGAKLLSEPSAQYAAHLFPLATIGKGGWDLYEWIQGYAAYWSARAAQLDEEGNQHEAELSRQRVADGQQFGDHLKDIMEQYQIAYVELDRDLPLDKVCDIFTQINSKGIRLDVFDLINALLKPRGLQLKHMWREAAPRLDFVESDRTNVYILQVMSILRQAYCSPKYLYYLLPGQERTMREPDGSLRKDVLVSSVEEFRALWKSAVEALERALNLLRHPQMFGAVSSDYLPYVSILPVFSALQEVIRRLPPERQLDAQRKARHWYWASVFTNRYSGSVESTAAKDFLDVRAWFTDDELAPALIGEFEARFRSLELRRETRRGTSVYNGIFNLLVIRGARDWITGNAPQPGDLDDHHIIPKSWGRENGIGQTIDSILNRTPLTSDTNRTVISDRLPNAYLRELIAENGEAMVRETLESHLISPAAFGILLRDPFTSSDFEDFISERTRDLQNAIEELLVKERLDLSPRLRELDSRIEAVELALRDLVAAAIDHKGGVLPPHLAVKAKERVAAARKRDPGLDESRFDGVGPWLEYLDFRELEAAITSKTLWDLFEERFRQKESLSSRFAQVAELRNAIRHSRTVGQVTLKDGEAGLLWFEEVFRSRADGSRADARY